MSMPNTVRKLNEARARQCLMKHRTLSRADLARELGLTRSTSSSIVSSLLTHGQILEQEESSPSREVRTGRPSISLTLNPDYAIFLGADIGASFIRLCAIDFEGNVRGLQAVRIDRDRTEPEILVEQLAQLVEDYCAGLPNPAIVKRLNVSVPGVVDFNGDVLRAPPLGWKRLALLELIQDRIKCVQTHRLLNDANAFSAACRNLDNKSALQNAVFLLIDEGVGGCVINNGEIIEGNQGFAGEIGHMPIGEGGFCNLTGIDGAFENFVARGAILERYQNLGGDAIQFDAFLDHLEAKDPLACDALSDWSYYMGKGLAVLTTLLDPEVIVVGGRIGDLLKYGLPKLQSDLASFLLDDTVSPRIEFAKIGPEGPALGAATLLRLESFSVPRQLS